MNCSRVREILPDFSVELLDRRTHQGVEAHLALCDGCRRELRALDQTMELVRTQGALEPPPGLFNAIRNQIEAGQVAQDRPVWWAWFNRPPVRFLSMGIAMASVAIALFIPLGQPHLPPTPDPHAGGSIGQLARGPLAHSIRQHARASAAGPLADRMAWEAMAQLADAEERRSRRSDAERRSRTLEEDRSTP